MKVPDMETLTESLEISMQNCSLTDRRRRIRDGFGRSDESNYHTPISDRTLELNSHLSLPCHWEQCLDLKTGEIYYINWKNGTKVKEDPRKVMNADLDSGESYRTLCSEEDSSYYYSEVSSSESSPSLNHKEEDDDDEAEEDEDEEEDDEDEDEEDEEEEDVLVVAGCKACFMYFMVPKHVEDCPKCAAELLHFDQSHSDSR